MSDLLCLFMKVVATDGDRDREQDIVYFLTGQGIFVENPDQSQFEVNRTSGEIFVRKVSLGWVEFVLYGRICCMPRNTDAYWILILEWHLICWLFHCVAFLLIDVSYWFSFLIILGKLNRGRSRTVYKKNYKAVFSQGGWNITAGLIHWVWYC